MQESVLKFTYFEKIFVGKTWGTILQRVIPLLAAREGTIRRRWCNIKVVETPVKILLYIPHQKRVK